MSPQALEQIRGAIRKKYAAVALSAAGKFSYPTGREGAEALGYDAEIISQCPAELLRSFCGVGNPFAIEPVKTGSTILDVGSGAGFDLFVAALLAGQRGRVYGIDLTEEMAAGARRNLAQSGVANITVLKVGDESIPFGDRIFDLVISNGVINLSPAKEKLFREIHRVLKPGGRLQFADIIAEKELPAAMTGSPEAWSQ